MIANGGGGGGSAPAITEPVLVAARDIPARQAVTPDDVTIRQVPIDEILDQSYTEAGLVVGRLTAVPVYADQQMTPNLFATSAADADFSILGPDEEVTLTSPYWRAVAVEVPNNRAVGGEIKAGQHVDLIVSVDIRVLTQDPETGEFQEIDTATEDGLMSGKSTKITYQDLEVLKADPDENMYVLKVNLHQAEEIGHVIQEAPDSFMIALRPETDTRTADTSQLGTTTDRLVMTYLFPAPQLIDLSQLLGAPITPGGTPGGAGGPTGSPAPSGSPTPGESPSPTPTPQPR
jgi:Flp pilus assembly protein CpaB